MTEVTQFVLCTSSNHLTIMFSDESKYNVSYEFLRVLSPSKPAGKTGANNATVCHKKTVKLLKIESVGKHGYRMIFDDQHQAIYSQELLLQLCQNHNQLWQQYLDDIKANGLSREGMINFTEVK